MATTTELQTGLIRQSAAGQRHNMQTSIAGQRNTMQAPSDRPSGASGRGSGRVRDIASRLFSLGRSQKSQIESAQEEWQATQEVIGNRAMTGGESLMANTIFKRAALHERTHSKMRDRCTIYHMSFSVLISAFAALAAALVALHQVHSQPPSATQPLLTSVTQPPSATQLSLSALNTIMAACCSLIAAISHAIANYQQFAKTAQEHHAAANRFLHVTNAAKRMFFTSKIREPRTQIAQLRELYMAALGSAPMVSLSVQAREDKHDVVKLIAQDVPPLPGQAVADFSQQKVAKLHEMFTIAKKNRELCFRRALRFQCLDCALGTSNAALLVASTSIILVSISQNATRGFQHETCTSTAAALLSGLVSLTAAAQNMLQPNRKSAQYHVAQIEFANLERQLEEALFCSPHLNPDTYYSDLRNSSLGQINTMKKEGLCCVDPDRIACITDDSNSVSDTKSDIESVSPMSFADEDVEELFREAVDSPDCMRT